MFDFDFQNILPSTDASISTLSVLEQDVLNPQAAAGVKERISFLSDAIRVSSQRKKVLNLALAEEQLKDSSQLPELDFYHNLNALVEQINNEAISKEITADSVSNSVDGRINQISGTPRGYNRLNLSEENTLRRVRAQQLLKVSETMEVT